ncbi:hypothetical protein [Streptomyces parvus]|uniref:Uncharacterized protein n=1 Tax=Streptomyces parvus TaxID=66428 RepID=A0A7K3RTQ5_9ACTN|nr:hypothetical protein [Streptomyces parvus]NEC18559.1 hypothetical protein [Streptomyces parvus]
MGLVALLGYALAMLTRRTPLALGIALACRVASGRIMQGYVPALAEHRLSVVVAAWWQFARRNVDLRRSPFGGSRRPFHEPPCARSLTLPWPVPLAPERATQDT